MTNIIKYNIESAFTEDSTAETSLALLGAGSTALGSIVTNGTQLAMLMDVSIQLASVNPSGSPYFEVHFLPLAGDGTTYVDFFSAGPTMVATPQLTTGSSAKTLVATGLLTPPSSFKVAFINQMNVSVAASGNKVFTRLYDYTSNG